jgi:hypothetical protein
MSARWFRRMLAGSLLVGLAVSGPVCALDRLERFRTVARERLGAGPGPERERATGELYELVDAEVLDSLRGDELFGSVVFIRERLDAMMETWGGVTLRVVRIPRTDAAGPLTVGLYGFTGEEGSLRLYTGIGPHAALAATSTHEGLLDAQAWSTRPDHATRLLAVWSGPPGGGGTRPLLAELWEERDRDRVQRAWSTTSEWPDGLRVSEWRTQAGELVVRYQPHYPGWKPSCAGQTEYEDHYRLAASGGLTLARRQVFNRWHRELGAATDRLFRALAGDDARALQVLVSPPALRARLPRGLVPEPVCEPDPPRGRPAAVTVAATELRDGRRVPWTLTWAHTSRGWQLRAATPVLE